MLHKTQIKKPRKTWARHGIKRGYFFLFTASLKALPAVNFTVRAAAILMVSPVRGLRPVRAARLPEPKVPNPTSCTASPLVTALIMVAIVAFSTSSTEAFDESVALATASTSSALFMVVEVSLKLLERTTSVTGARNPKASHTSPSSDQNAWGIPTC